MGKIFCLIPARGGSKSIPRKNLALIEGKPLLTHTVQAALGCAQIDRTFVSTDSDEIAQTARQAGAEVPFVRPAELAQDETPDWPVFKHFLGWLKEQGTEEPELLLHLRPTCPTRIPKTLAEAIRAMRLAPEADSLRSVSRPEQTPYKMWKQAGEFLEPLLTLPNIPEPFSQPRQHLPQVFWQNGYLDIVRPKTVLRMNSMAGKKVLPFMIDEPFVEIDYMEDLARAEQLLRSRREGKSPLSVSTQGRFSV